MIKGSFLIKQLPFLFLLLSFSRVGLCDNNIRETPYSNKWSYNSSSPLPQYNYYAGAHSSEIQTTYAASNSSFQETKLESPRPYYPEATYDREKNQDNSSGNYGNIAISLSVLLSLGLVYWRIIGI